MLGDSLDMMKGNAPSLKEIGQSMTGVIKKCLDLEFPSSESLVLKNLKYRPKLCLRVLIT